MFGHVAFATGDFQGSVLAHRMEGLQHRLELLDCRLVHEGHIFDFSLGSVDLIARFLVRLGTRRRIQLFLNLRLLSRDPLIL